MHFFRTRQHIALAFKDWISRPLVPIYFFVSGIILLCDYCKGDKLDKLALTYFVIASLPFFFKLASSLRTSRNEAQPALKTTTSPEPNRDV